MDWPYQIRHHSNISSWSRECLGYESNVIGAMGTLASAAWPQANRAHAVPLRIESPFLIRSFFTMNGATAGGNHDVAIFSAPDPVNAQVTLIANCGSTAQTGTSTVQIMTLGTPVLLTPGSYRLAMNNNGTTGRYARGTPAIVELDMMGVTVFDAAVPFVGPYSGTSFAAAYFPCYGISQLASGY